MNIVWNAIPIGVLLYMHYQHFSEQPEPADEDSCVEASQNSPPNSCSEIDDEPIIEEFSDL